MTRNHFSYAKLQKFQKQKQRIAELETVRRKTALDESVQRLDSLNVRFDEAVRRSTEDLEGDATLIHTHRGLIDHLRQEIERALEAVKENEAAWKRTAAEGTAEKIKAESYDMLCETEQAALEAETEKAEMEELSDIVLRQLTGSEGEITDG